MTILLPVNTTATLVIIVNLRIGTELVGTIPLLVPVQWRGFVKAAVLLLLLFLPSPVVLADEHTVDEAAYKSDKAEHQHEDAQEPHVAGLEELEYEREAQADEDQREVEQDHEEAQSADTWTQRVLVHHDLALDAATAGRARRGVGCF